MNSSIIGESDFNDGIHLNEIGVTKLIEHVNNFLKNSGMKKVIYFKVFHIFNSIFWVQFYSPGASIIMGLHYYALINRARGPYEEIFVLTFKAYGPNAARSMRLERQNKYFPYGSRSRLIRALLYTHIHKLIFQ